MQTAVRFVGILGAFIVISASLSSSLCAENGAYEERATKVIYNSLKRSKKLGFLRRFYKRLLFLPAWMHQAGPSAVATDFFRIVQNDRTLQPEMMLYRDGYDFWKQIEALYDRNASLLEKMRMEFRTTLLYQAYTDYRYFGSINWGAFQARIANLKVNDVSTEWELHRPGVDTIGMVEAALLGQRLGTLMRQADPKGYHYEALRKALVRYLAIKRQGGWPTVRLQTRVLKPGMHDSGVEDLRERLRITGEYSPCFGRQEGEAYDECLRKAVMRFQARHGLAEDGVVGPATLRALNVPVSRRIQTIRLNLDRIKWLDPRMPKRRIIINIPFFELYFEQNGTLVFSTPVVVGKPKHPTPIFSDEVERIVLNPYWNVPKNIARKEMIPKLMRNPYALKKQGIVIYDGWSKNAQKIDPASIDWSAYRYGKRLPFRFAQPPGSKNALGRVKFLFPNRFSVYMHDTPAKSLFRRQKRAFSHGCVRVQKPIDLLRYFTTIEPDLDWESVARKLKSGKNVHLRLSRKIPVDIVYLTAWVDYEGVLQFRDDVYGYDAMQLKSYKRW